MQEINKFSFEMLPFLKQLSVYQKIKHIFIKDRDEDNYTSKRNNLYKLSFNHDSIIQSITLTNEMMSMVFDDLESADADTRDMLVVYGFHIINPLIVRSQNNMLAAVRFFEQKNEEYNAFADEMMVETLKNLDPFIFDMHFIERLKALIESNETRSANENTKLFRAVMMLLMRESQYRDPYKANYGYVVPKKEVYNRPTEFAVRLLFNATNDEERIKFLNTLIEEHLFNCEYSSLRGLKLQGVDSGQKEEYKKELLIRLIEGLNKQNLESYVKPILTTLDIFFDESPNIFVRNAKRMALNTFLVKNNREWLKQNQSFNRRIEKEIAIFSRELKNWSERAEVGKLQGYENLFLNVAQSGFDLLDTIREQGYDVYIDPRTEEYKTKFLALLKKPQEVKPVKSSVNFVEKINEFINEEFKKEMKIS